MIDLTQLQLGMTREEVQAAVGAPQQTGGMSRRQRIPRIWKYGDVELHFRPSGELWLIYREDAEGNPEVIAIRNSGLP